VSALKGHWQLIALTALVFVLWSTPVMFPLKILVVFLHETAHGAAAVLSGGSVVAIDVTLQQGGLATTRGGNLFLILSAGYVGSLMIGVLLFAAAVQTRADRVIMALLGGAILAITAFYVREYFAFVFGLLAGAAMLAAARYLRREINDLALRVIGLTSMIYVPYDIFSDTIARSGMRSDAYMLAENFGGTAAIWGGLWLGFSLVVIGFNLRRGLSQSSNIAFGKG
jgi:Peptidase M50B-like